MRITHAVLSLSLFLNIACQDKEFSGGTKTGAADASPEDPKQHKSKPVESVNSEAPSKEIEFGADEVYRIGDGQSSLNSACIGEVKSHDLKGTVYHFQFEVLEDDTSVDVSVGKFCGVDQAGFTAIALKDESNKALAPEISVPIDASGSRANPYQPFAGAALKKGLYSVVVTSKNTAGRASKSSDPNVDEYDDFVIGKIKINSNKNVRQIKVFAE